MLAKLSYFATLERLLESKSETKIRLDIPIRSSQHWVLEYEHKCKKASRVINTKGKYVEHRIASLIDEHQFNTDKIINYIENELPEEAG